MWSKKKFYRTRNGTIRRYNSYSVGYSEALASGLIPDNASNRKKYGNAFDNCSYVEWHHGLRGAKVYFYSLTDLLNNAL